MKLDIPLLRERTEPDVVPTGGRRLAQLLRRAGDDPQRAPLSLADVEALRGDRSPERRAVVAAKLGHQLGAVSEGSERDLANAILGLLVRDVAAEVRKSLANAIAANPDVPPPIVRQLAQDEIEVARPVLERSPVLTDDDLLQIVRTNAMQYALAVAGRERLSEMVADALVDTGAQPVVARLVANAGAKLSVKTLQRVIEEYEADREVQARLVRRPELPYDLIEQLVGLIGDRLEWELVRTRRMSPDLAHTIMSGVRNKAKVGLVSKEPAEKQLFQELSARHKAGQLDHEALLKLLKDGDIAGLEIGLTIHAGLDLPRVRRMLYNSDRRHLAALCIKAGFATAHYIVLRMAIELAEESLSPQPARGSYSSQAVCYLQQQYERLRQEPAKVHELITTCV